MTKKIFLILFLLVSIFFVYSCDEGGGKLDFDDKVFKTVTFVTDQIQYEKIELALIESKPTIAENGNPYDYDYIKVIAEITSPSGITSNVPAFWYQGYDINVGPTNTSPSGISGEASKSTDEVQGLELVSMFGDPHFRVRFTASEYGKYSYVIKVYQYGLLISSENYKEFNVEKAETESKGILEVDTTNNRTFRYSNTKETCVLVGQNTCWYTSSTRKTEDYRVWFENMNENNMNGTRIWMATWGFCLHWNKSYTNFDKAYANAARLDKMVELAEEYDIYYLLCLNNHGQFSTAVNSEWSNNPYNSKNGGILDQPYQFFYNEEAKRAYKNELMYIIARWGYSENIIAWELFNEVDWIDSAQTFDLSIKRWHDEMAKFIKANDPYNHMVSTSYKGTDGTAFGLDSIDFSMPHDYSYTNKAMCDAVLNTQTWLAEKYDKPVLFGEIGIYGNNGVSNYNADPNGTSIHQAQWSGMMGGAVSGAFNWWWDSYVHPYNLYSQFNGAGLFSKKMNLSGSDYKLLSSLSYTSSNSNLKLMGYSFDDRMYGYVYDKAWLYTNTNSLVAKKNVLLTIPFTNGTYTITLYNTTNCEVISSNSITCSNGKLSISLPDVTTDLAFIIE